MSGTIKEEVMGKEKIVYKEIRGKKRNSRKAMLLACILPGWGQWYSGRRGKGVFLMVVTLVGVSMMVHGMLMWVMPDLFSPLPESSDEQEVIMDPETGVVLNPPKEEPAQEESQIPLLPVGVIVAGLIILTWAGIYGVKDTRRFWSKG